jgi:hypothetical protein
LFFLEDLQNQTIIFDNHSITLSEGASTIPFRQRTCCSACADNLDVSSRSVMRWGEGCWGQKYLFFSCKVFELMKRDDVIIATKVFSGMGPGPKDAGLSRAAIFAQVEQRRTGL